MVVLLILKHTRNLSDKSVVLQWGENAYYQYFCGENMFVPHVSCSSSELVHFRNCIGEKGIDPTIGQLKSDLRLGCNFYKGIVGDFINVLLAAIAYNFKRALNVLLPELLLTILQVIYQKNPTV